MLFAALWYALFAIPFFRICPDAPKTGMSPGQALRTGLSHLRGTIQSTCRVPHLITFLVASAFFRDGLVTLFAVGGLYAAGTLHMNFSDIMIFAIAMNLAGGVGALSMAHLDDRLGSRRTIILCLVMLIVLGGILLMLTDKTAFIAVACLLGLFVGPVQAASRSLLVRLSPPENIGAYFGLYALTGKSIAFMGPFAFAAVTHLTGSQRLGMATILVFWGIGLSLIAQIRDTVAGQ
jgi:UMF1 family MFS transporter